MPAERTGARVVKAVHGLRKREPDPELRTQLEEIAGY
jgi:hypothetical protein